MIGREVNALVERSSEMPYYLRVLVLY